MRQTRRAFPAHFNWLSFDPRRGTTDAITFPAAATSEDIAYTCHAHPTHAEAFKEAAMAVTGKPIHI